MTIEINTTYDTQSGSKILIIDNDGSPVKPWLGLIVELSDSAKPFANLGDTLRFDDNGRTFLYPGFANPFDLKGFITMPAPDNTPSAPGQQPQPETKPATVTPQSTAILTAIQAALSLAEKLWPLLADAVRKGEVSIEQQQQVRARYESLKTRADAQFTGAHWEL